MSTASLSYPNVIRLRRVPAMGAILLLSSFVLFAITSLVVAISAHANLTDRAAFSQSSVVVLVPVPAAPIAEIQPIPSETSIPYPEEAREPSVMPVPVPTPPPQ